MFSKSWTGRIAIVGIVFLAAVSTGVLVAGPSGHHRGRCVDGQCYPNVADFGHYQTNWRKWPSLPSAKEEQMQRALENIRALDRPDPSTETEILPSPSERRPGRSQQSPDDASKPAPKVDRFEAVPKRQWDEAPQPGNLLFPEKKTPTDLLPGLPSTDLQFDDFPATELPGTTLPGTGLPGTALPDSDLPGGDLDLRGGDRPGSGLDLPGGDRPGGALDLPGSELPSGLDDDLRMDPAPNALPRIEGPTGGRDTDASLKTSSRRTAGRTYTPPGDERESQFIRQTSASGPIRPNTTIGFGNPLRAASASSLGGGGALRSGADAGTTATGHWAAQSNPLR